MMKKIIFGIIVLFLFQFFISGELIEKIVIEGNKKVSRDTVLFYMKSRANGIYSANILKSDFKALWETGFFKNIRIESDAGTKGRIVKLILKENYLISTITYKTSKKFSKDDIASKLQENNIVLMPFSYYSPVKIKRIETIISDMLIEKGYNDGKVTITSNLEKDQYALTIEVIRGPKTRIGAVDFPGLDSKQVSPSYISGGMKNNKSHSLLSWVGGKDVHNKEKIKEDLEGIKLKLQEKGYLEARVGNPTLSMFEKKQIFGKTQKMLKISIPVELGPQYMMGNVKIEGNKVIKAEYLKRAVRLKKGKVYNMKKRNKAVEEIRKFYGGLGFFYCQVVPVENLDPVKKVADLTIKLIENKVAFLGKLEFVGNTFTKDHVIRREWFLKEGKVLNVNALETSLRRMKQLGLVTIEKMPEIKPDSQDPQKINIKCEVKELNRQMINFNVGYSGYNGWFIGLGYSTQNFLGLGESFALSLQSGTRSKTYRFAFTEPYLFNLPASMGIDIHKTSFEYPNLYTRKGNGFSLVSSNRFWRYWGSSISFSFERIEVSDVNTAITWSNPLSFYYYTEGKRTISAISPTIYYSTIDSPLFPTSGVRYLLNYRYSGGFLGGDIDLHKIKLEFAKFMPFAKRHTIGLHGVYQSLSAFGKTVDVGVPFYEKYFLGGERSIRGFDIMRLGPKDANGYVVGGSKSLYLNFEYQIPLNQQFSFIFFYDIGNAYDFGHRISLKDVYQSMGMELKLFIPMLNAPFRLIFAYNPRTIRPGDSNFVFRFAVGPSF